MKDRSWGGDRYPIGYLLGSDFRTHTTRLATWGLSTGGVDRGYPQGVWVKVINRVWIKAVYRGYRYVMSGGCAPTFFLARSSPPGGQRDTFWCSPISGKIYLNHITKWHIFPSIWPSSFSGVAGESCLGRNVRVLQGPRLRRSQSTPILRPPGILVALDALQTIRGLCSVDAGALQPFLLYERAVPLCCSLHLVHPYIWHVLTYAIHGQTSNDWSLSLLLIRKSLKQLALFGHLPLVLFCSVAHRFYPNWRRI